MERRGFVLGCGCAGLLALAAAARADWSAPSRFARPDPGSDEGGLWAIMDREEKRLRRSAFLLRDQALNCYVGDLVCALAGEHCPDVRTYLVRVPWFNASMAPNGMMQVWSGLLLRMSNEAQLAAVLGHEIGHYLARHSIDQLRDAKTRSAFAQFIGIALGAAGAGGAAPLAQLAVLASGFAYNRDQEREADRIGLELMTGAGYAPMEASRVWSQLLEEQKAGDKDENWSGTFLFASHPPGEERQKTLAELAEAKGSSGGTTGEAGYQAALAAHRKDFLQDELRRRKPSESLVLLERMLKATPDDGELEFFEGEALRLRAGEGDRQRAAEVYREAADKPGAPPEVHRSLGLVERNLAHDEASQAAFRRYLELKPGAEDAAMIRSYVEGGSR
ncbi:MAG TPA: M48 family metalloprotease [Burkholderiales bacterium]